jgi:hypothetical protein
MSKFHAEKNIFNYPGILLQCLRLLYGSSVRPLSSYGKGIVMGTTHEVCIQLTRHASNRAQQRGIKNSTIGLVLAYADVELHAGEGFISLFMSRTNIKKLIRKGIPAALLEKSHGVVLLINSAGTSIVSVMHGGGKDGKRHRRQYPTRKYVQNKVS